jgi:hypothetical protein
MRVDAHPHISRAVRLWIDGEPRNRCAGSHEGGRPFDICGGPRLRRRHFWPPALRGTTCSLWSLPFRLPQKKHGMDVAAINRFHGFIVTSSPVMAAAAAVLDIAPMDGARMRKRPTDNHTHYGLQEQTIEWRKLRTKYSKRPPRLDLIELNGAY